MARIDWLDYSRFLAALAVVLFHYLSKNTPNGPASYGYLGVDFFFIVSGFVIMASVGTRTGSEFAVARFIRLYPAFLVCMTLTALVTGATASQYLANLTMIPAALGFRAVDGVYWSLSLELAFYACVWLVIVLGQTKRLETIVAAWIALQAVSISLYPLPMFSGHFTLFAAGCVFSFASREGWTATRVELVVAALLLSLTEVSERALGLGSNVTVCRLATIAFFGAFAFFHHRDISLPRARFVGSLSYPLYLLHCYIGWAVLSVFPHPAVVMVGMVVAAALVAEFELRLNSFNEREVKNDGLRKRTGGNIAHIGRGRTRRALSVEGLSANRAA